MKSENTKAPNIETIISKVLLGIKIWMIPATSKTQSATKSLEQKQNTRIFDLLGSWIMRSKIILDRLNFKNDLKQNMFIPQTRPIGRKWDSRTIQSYFGQETASIEVIGKLFVKPTEYT